MAEGEDLSREEKKSLVQRSAKADELLGRFATLLDTAGREEELQVFLEDHPQLLYANYLDVYPKRKLGAEFVTDYVILVQGPQGKEYVFVEIEKVDKPIFVKKGYFSAEFTQAKNQLLDWERWLQKHHAYARDYLSGLYAPRFHLVIGRGSDLTSEQREKIQTEFSKGPYTFSTYDDLLEQFKTTCQHLRDEVSNLDALKSDGLTRDLEALGVKSYKLGPKGFQSAEFDETVQMHIRAEGPAVEKLKALMEEAENGRYVKQEFAPSDDIVTFYSPEELNALLERDGKEKIVGLEVGPIPQELMLRYSINGVSEVLSTNVVFERNPEKMVLVPKASVVNFKLTLGIETKNINIDCRIDWESEKRPSLNDLPLLRILSQLDGDAEVLSIGDASTGIDFAQVSLKKARFFEEVASIARFLESFIWASHFLEREGLIDQDLIWPLEVSNDSKLRIVLERITRFYRDGQLSFPLTLSTMVDKSYNPLHELIIDSSILEGQIKVVDTINFDSVNSVKQVLYLRRPAIKLFDGEQIVEAKSLSEAFRNTENDLKVILTQENTEVAFERI